MIATLVMDGKYCNGGMERLTGKVAVITGGSRGIGLGTARAFIARGARVVITGTREDTLAAAARELGDQAVPVRADVRSYQDVEATMADAVRRLGGIDVVVNN